MFTVTKQLNLGGVRGVAWSDDQTVFVASTAGVFRTDATSLERSMFGPPVGGIALSADGGRAALACTAPRRPLVVSVADGSVIWERPERVKDSLGAVALSPDGQTLVYGVGKTGVCVVDLSTGQERTLELPPRSRGLGGAAFLVDGGLLLWNGNGTVQVWQDDTAVHTWKHHRWVDGVVELGDGNLLLAGNPDTGMVTSEDSYLWVRSRDGSEVARLSTPTATDHQSRQLALALSPDGRHAVCGGEDHYVHVLRTDDWTQVAGASLNPTGGSRKWPAWAVAWSPSGERFAVVTGSKGNIGHASFRHSLQIFDIEAARQALELGYNGAAHDIDAVAGVVAVGHEWGVDIHQDGGSRRVSALNANAVALSADATMLLVCKNGYPGKVEVVNVASGEVMETPPVKDQDFHSVVFAPDGEHYAVAGDDPAVRKLGRKSAVVCDKNRKRVRGVAFSPDGRWYAAAGSDGKVTLGEGKGFATAHTLTMPEVETRRGKAPDKAFAIAFSSDSSKLVVGCGNGLRVFDLHSRSEQRLVDTDGAQLAVAWSGDGRFVASGSVRGQLRVWDTAQWSCVSTVQMSGRVSHLVFDGDRLFATAEGGAAVCLQSG
jgi:WD40 repeat protein